MESERIELPGGQWWEIKSDVTYGMQRAFSKAQLSAAASLANRAGVDISDREAMTAAVAANIDMIDIGALEDAWINLGSVKWSFKGKPSAAGALEMSDKFVAPVIARMRELYTGLDDEALAVLDEKLPN